MKIAVIGAGIGGLAAAYDLTKAGHQVTVFEAAEKSGGLASGFKEPGWEWSVEKYYHHWFTSDKYMFGLLRELGLEKKVIIRGDQKAHYGKIMRLMAACAQADLWNVSFAAYQEPPPEPEKGAAQ